MERGVCCDDTETSQYLPLNGSNNDALSRTAQFIYPSTKLESIKDWSLHGMAFYLNDNSSYSFDGVYKLYLQEVKETTLTEFHSIPESSLVYTGTIEIFMGELVIAFDREFVYHGGNLLVSIVMAKNGTVSASTFFKGESSTGSGYWGLPDGYSFAVDFLPHVVFVSDPEFLPESYDLWVGGTNVNVKNAADVFVDGKVSFDAETNTLTLDNYTFEGKGYFHSNSEYSCCFSALCYNPDYKEVQPLNMVLIGDNTIKEKGSAAERQRMNTATPTVSAAVISQ